MVFDTLRRYLEFLGYGVKHVQNFTDIDDKIIQRAQEAGISEGELVEEFIGIVRGRKSSSSRGQAAPAPKRSAREKTMAKQAARAAAGKVASIPGKPKRGRR